MLLSELADQDIGILGAGREGLSAWRWLRRHFPAGRITIYDEGADTTLPDGFAEPLDRLVSGPFDERLLCGHPVLIRSPGISPYRKDLAAVRAHGVRFSSASNLWFAQHPDQKTICITGTKGKSTTAALTDHLLRGAGCSTVLAGNIGQPLLDAPVAGVDWWIIELSSYQLTDLEARPTIAAVTNLSDEHLDWHGSGVQYRRDKLRLIDLAGDSPKVVNALDRELSMQMKNRPDAYWFGKGPGFTVRNDSLLDGDIPLDNIPREHLPGPHNLENLAAALTICRLAGHNIEDPAPALAGYRGLPHRLQRLGMRNGISYVNDSLSTTPVATVAALQALSGERVILLAGGLDRGLDWRSQAPHIKNLDPYAVICLPDNGSAVAAALKDSGFAPAGGIQCVSGLEEAMVQADGLAGPGDTVLLSPGAPSFPHFRDYGDRGLKFAQLAGFRAIESQPAMA